MDNITKEWYAYYSCSPSGERASYVEEPIKKSCYHQMTEVEAHLAFTNGLIDHVRMIISRVSALSNNKQLKKRLQKYNCLDALNTLLQIEQMIKELPKL